MEESQIRYGLSVDNDSAARLEAVPSFIQSNQRVMCRQSYDGGLLELISQENTVRFPGRERDEMHWACLWLQFFFIRFYAPLNDGFRPSALEWRLVLQEGEEVAPGQDGRYFTTYGGQIVPRTHWRRGSLDCTITTLAPHTSDARPRGVLYAISVMNRGARHRAGTVRLVGKGVLGETCEIAGAADSQQILYQGHTTKAPEPMIDGLRIPAGPHPAYAVLAPYDPATSCSVGPEPTLEWMMDLAPGEEHTWVVALGLGSSREEADQELRLVLSRPQEVWLEETVDHVSAPLGDLTIEGGEWWSEFLLNHVHQGNATLNVDALGHVIGGRIGPDMLQDTVQEADIVHGMQVHHLMNPDLFKEFVLFYYRYLVPPPAVPFILNTQAAVAPPILAEMYFRATNDIDFFVDHPEIGEQTKVLLDELLKWRAPDHWLFPAEEVSDGHPITEYDLCTNIRIWEAFRAAARIMGEVYDQPGLGAQYSAMAQRVRTDILETMVVDGVFGPQFAAGTDLPGTVCFLDGEDNLGAMAPYLGFCDFTDERWRNYARHALSSHNVTYEPITGGQRWYDDPNVGHYWIPLTAPSFAAAVQLAMTRDEACEALGNIRWLADVDTSFYWWPLPHQIRPDVGLICHSLWMTGGVSTVILQHYLGIDLDVPERQLTFKPWLLWHGYSWEDVTLGRGRFSFRHIRGERAHSSIVTNLNGAPWTVVFGFYVPPGKRCDELRINGEVYSGEVTKGTFHRERLLTIQSNVDPGKTAKVTAVLLDDEP